MTGERTTQQLRHMTAQERAGYWAIRAGEFKARLTAAEEGAQTAANVNRALDRKLTETRKALTAAETERDEARAERHETLAALDDAKKARRERDDAHAVLRAYAEEDGWTGVAARSYFARAALPADKETAFDGYRDSDNEIN